MTETWGIVFGLATLLGVAVVLQPVARWIRLPYTVLLTIVGATLAYLVSTLNLAFEPLADMASEGHMGQPHGDAAAPHDGPLWRQALGALTSLNITADVVLFVFLPALVFESALSIDLRKLWKDAGAILFLAVVGVLLSTAIAGSLLSATTGAALVTCLLIGAIVSATDPVAVVALFKDLGAPRRLTILVEGESLFNDATAIVMATILVTLITQTGGEAFSLSHATLDFFVVFLGGIVVGLVLSWAAFIIMTPFRNQSLSVVTLSLVLPFITFIVAEHFLHVSGVMAAVVSGLALGSRGRRIIPPQIFTEIEHSWHQIAFWATALIFLLVGLTTPSLLGDNFLTYLDEALLLYVIATLGRAGIVYGFIPLLGAAKIIEPVSRAVQTIMIWGGLRGAVSLALALVVLASPGIDSEIASFVAVLVTVFVFATLLIQATTIAPLMNRLGLGQLSPENTAVRNRSLAWARASVADELRAHAPKGDAHAVIDDIASAYERDAAAPDALDEVDRLSTAEWVRTGLNLALSQERQYYLEAYGDGAISSGRLREILARIDDSIEAVRNTKLTASYEDSLARLSKAAGRFVDHTPKLYRAAAWQRRAGRTKPLAEALSLRFSVLTAALAALTRQQEEGVEEIRALLPERATAPFTEIYEHRVEEILRAHNAFSRQYPSFAEAVDRRNLERMAQRLEKHAFDRLHENGLISGEVYSSLIEPLNKALHAGAIPTLDLRYDAKELIGNVPLFADLTEKEREKIASVLKVKFFAPGQTVLSKGESGDAMYFVANGAVDILLPNASPVELGTGAFFGELSLIDDAPRSADVVSAGFSTLLELKKRDFAATMRRNRGLGQKIEDVADRRRLIATD